jgi:uncharacterized protein
MSVRTRTIVITFLLILGSGDIPAPCLGQEKSAAPQPVIDVHWHAPGKTDLPATLEMFRSLNVKYVVLLGTYGQLDEMKAAGEGRFLPALTFPCENGKSVNIGITCFEDGGVFPNIATLRERIKSGQVGSFGELNAQYLGIAPNDPRLEPYYALAEELDVPIGIHLGIGPPGAAYAGRSGFPPVKSPNYRGASGDPLLLEEVLLKHPRLRLYVMHAAYPFRDAIVYMLYMHPQIYVDVSVLQWAIPRPAYYGYLKTLVEAGYGKRIMFGSDGGPQRLKEGVEAVMNADFLTAEQKSDILYNNAAKFFRFENGGGAAK